MWEGNRSLKWPRSRGQGQRQDGGRAYACSEQREGKLWTGELSVDLGDWPWPLAAGWQCVDFRRQGPSTHRIIRSLKGFKRK